MKRDEFKDPFSGRRGCFHLSSSHLETNRLFRDADDFIYGVNTLALLLPASEVGVVAYCLMDNHLHSLLVGTFVRCLAYYDKVAHRLSQMLRERYGLSGALRRKDVDVSAVTTEPQFKNAICYIHRNPYKARISSPIDYTWSSSDMYFMPSYPVGVKVAALSHKEKCRLFKTHLEVPDTYEHIGGRVLNSSFVSSSSAMARFRDSVEYFDLLRRYSLEYEVESASGLKESIVFSDSELSERLLEMCRNDFHASSLAALDRKSLLRLARIASFRYGARSAQLARLTGIGKETLDRIL